MMKGKIKVSVLTPIYNHAITYVRSCLNSLMAQTLQEVEFILIDNGANAESKQLIEEFLQKDKRFTVLHIEKNQGYGFAMNQGLARAKGEYIGIVESDDLTHPDMFKDLYEAGHKSGADLVKGLFSPYRGVSIQRGGISFAPNQYNKCFKPLDIPDFCIRNGSGSYWSAIYKKEALEKNDIKFDIMPNPSAEDIMFMLKTFCLFDSIYIVNKSYYYHRMDNPNSSIHRKDRIARDCAILYEKLDEFFKSKGDRISAELWNIKHEREFFNLYLHFKYNISRDRLRYLFMLRKRMKPLFKQNVLRFSQKHQALLEEIIHHPFLFYFKNLSRTDNSLIETIFSIKNTPNKEKKVVTIFGHQIQFRRHKSTRKLIRELQDETRSLREFIYQINWLPQRVAALHQQVFPQFHNLHTQDELVIVGCGPTMNYYAPLPKAKHIALNRAIRNTKIKFDYAFIWDLSATQKEEPSFMQEFLQYDCIKFVGKFLHDCLNTSVEELPHKNKLYRCYSASRAGFDMGVCDPVIHQDISLFPLADFMSISFGALNFAAYTHPKKIYLVGLDTQQTPCFDGREHPYYMRELMLGYHLFQQFFERYYPDVEVISINPVGLKGKFKDVYTQDYVDEHPELLEEGVEILNTQEN